MAASETVRLRLHFDYPPPASPNCSSFWLLVDLTRCRVVTDLISLIRQRFGFSSGALLGLYLDGGLLPPTESARLVRDNDCLRIKLEERVVAENTAVVSNGDGGQLVPRKAKKRTFKLEEDEETELDCRASKKRCRRQENSKSSEKNLTPEPKSSTGHSVRKKNKKKKKTTGQGVDDDDDEEEEEEEVEEKTQRKIPKKKEKREHRKRTKHLKSSKAQAAKEWTIQNTSSSNSAHAQNSLLKGKTKGGVDSCPKGSPSSNSDSESASEGLGNAVSENAPTELSKEGPPTKTGTASKVAAKPGFPDPPAPGKSSGTSSSDSDSSSESDAQSTTLKIGSKNVVQTVGFAGRASPGQGSLTQTPSPTAWKYSDANGGPQVLSPPPNVTLPSAVGRGWGRGEDFLPWKGARGRGMRGRGRGRVFSNVLNRNAENVKQQQLSDVVTNSSIIIQNPVEMPKNENVLVPPPRDYSVLPQLAAAPQAGEKIAFKLLELALDYSPGVSEYKEGKILNHNPETQQIDIEILSSLPATKEPGKFDLVYHNENGTEVVEYAVTQEKKITVFWRELIEPRLIIESPNNKSSLKFA